jgi:hypothetical protein
MAGRWRRKAQVARSTVANGAGIGLRCAALPVNRCVAAARRGENAVDPKPIERRIPVTVVLAALAGVATGMAIQGGCRRVAVSRTDAAVGEAPVEKPAAVVAADVALEPALPTRTEPTRTEPARFPPDTHLPAQPELAACAANNPNRFSPGRDLARVEDSRVEWESDRDSHDDEDDHTMHRAVQGPLTRLVELVTRHGGKLIVQDAYRPQQIHNAKSLHKEGRAVDLTAEGITLEKLAKLCWVAGFDWVYYEASGKGGDHIHCSVNP